ncbi:hypothetical protein [Devosia naphthalenivorans]|uniref:hypothetical protein n=1 Tax=Devosia naphthalenivorans TaxID=2082392 RepID=UPI000D34456B|nr:hypothetical protein [Devosia naphthalenivorans]
MALTPAEKQKRYRERQKEARKAAPDLTANFLRTPFFEYVDGREEWGMYFDMMGIDPPSFEDDSGPKSAWGEVEAGGEEAGEDPYGAYSKDSLGRAESMVSLLLDAATALAHTINSYKLAEIDARVAEVEQADLSDPAARAKGLQDIVTLQGIRASLAGKTFRRSFAEISVKGSYSE